MCTMYNVHNEKAFHKDQTVMMWLDWGISTDGIGACERSIKSMQSKAV